MDCLCEHTLHGECCHGIFVERYLWSAPHFTCKTNHYSFKSTRGHVVHQVIFMKKTLLVAAFAAIASMASAQTSEALRVKGNFTFIPQCIAEKANYSIPVALDWNEGSYQLQVYDANFNKERSFDIAGKNESYKSYQETATIKAKTRVSNWKTWWEGTSNMGITDYDTWVAFAKENVGKDAVFFTDPEGNWAAYTPTGVWDTYYDYGYRNVHISLWYMCFDNVKQVPRNGQCEIVLDLPDNIEWQKVDGTEVSYFTTISFSWLRVYDYSSATPIEINPAFSQTLFNADDKIEYSIAYDKEVKESDYFVATDITHLSEDFTEVSLSRKAQDKYYERTVGIFDEAGNEIIGFPAGTLNVEVYKVNGNTYLNALEGNESVLYLLDKTTTSVQEVARCKAAQNAPTFNMAGMKVDKKAKGLVIQKGGIKYINK